MGYNLADLSWILRNPQEDHLYDLWNLNKVDEIEE